MGELKVDLPHTSHPILFFLAVAASHRLVGCMLSGGVLNELIAYVCAKLHGFYALLLFMQSCSFPTAKMACKQHLCVKLSHVLSSPLCKTPLVTTPFACHRLSLTCPTRRRGKEDGK